MMAQQNIRDTFWQVIYEEACDNKEIVIVSADLGAASLDDFRRNLPNQFIQAGIAEQTAITVAAGLAMKGKRVYVYACAPFIFMRCYEQIKLAVADTSLPVTIVGQGYGLCYAESGVTHHTLEDVGAIRMLPNITLYTPADERMARKAAELTLHSNAPSYIRLDRPTEKEIYKSEEEISMETGFSLLEKGEQTALLSCGHMLHFAREIAEDLKKKGIRTGLIDLFAVNADKDKLEKTLRNYKNIVVLEEHTDSCGMASYIAELCMEREIRIRLKSCSMKSKTGYQHHYGSRKHMWKLYGLEKDDIISYISVL